MVVETNLEPDEGLLEQRRFEDYWLRDDDGAYVYHVRHLAEAWGYATEQSFRADLPALITDIRCIRCGIEVLATSRAERGRIHPRTALCADCDLKVAAEQQRRWNERDEQLRRAREHLTSMPYPEYLKTEHWGKVRSAELRRAGYRCRLCNGRKPLQVHHRTYKRRGSERASDVIALCADCHKTFHGIIR